MPFLAARPENQPDSAGLSKIPPNIAEQNRAAPSEFLADTKPLQIDVIQEKLKAVGIILNEALKAEKAKFPVMVPHLGAMFKHFDPDDVQTPEPLALIWLAKGGADTQAIRYIAHFIENDPDAPKVVAAFDRLDNFKARLNLLYQRLPRGTAAFDLETEQVVRNQLKAYLDPQK